MTKHADKKLKENILILSLPFPPHNTAGVLILQNFLDLLQPFSEKITIITGNFPINHFSDDKIIVKNLWYENESKDISVKILFYVLFILRMSYQTLLTPKKKLSCCFFFRGSTLVIPHLILKMSGVKTIMIITGTEAGSSARIRSKFISRIVGFFENINFHLSDKIIVYTPVAVTNYNLTRFRNKIIDQGARFLDVKIFKVLKKINERRKTVGFIGRFSEEKGIQNFIESIPMISHADPSVEFLIIGNGPMKEEVHKKIETLDQNQITLMDWVSHENLPFYLNDLSLLVVPSYSEGLPNIILEAMACGTPVLSTNVGSIPDIIQHGKTGFIMGDNTPETISENVIRSLNFQDLPGIIVNSQKMINENFTYESALKRYEKILRNI